MPILFIVLLTMVGQLCTALSSLAIETDWALMNGVNRTECACISLISVFDIHLCKLTNVLPMQASNTNLTLLFLTQSIG